MTSKTIYSDSYKDLTMLLREARENAGITQEQLANALGEDQSFVSKVERRERRLDIEELRRFCSALGVKLADIIARWAALIEPEASIQNPFWKVPEKDSEWSDLNWKALIDWFAKSGILSYKEIAALILGHLNPSQVGTSIASKPTFQSHFPPKKCWAAVRDWHFAQTGKCRDCGTRLELQADHITPRENLGDEADRLENMTLRCRRCNVIRRPSHTQGGLTFLTAEAGLMWILFTKRPSTYQKYKELCRTYGMTMADIRFQESWAMARWLEREGLYQIDKNSKY